MWFPKSQDADLRKGGGRLEKVAILGVMAVLLAIPLKKDKSEFAMLLIMVSCLIIGTLAIWKIKDVVNFLKSLESYLGEGSVYLNILLKMIGITYVAEFGSNLCRDAGYSAVASQIEFYGKLMILAVSMPILMTLFQTLMGL